MQRTRALRAPNVAAAFLSVPRHVFIPEQTLETAYEDRALALKEQDGNVLSSISQPGMVAQMLEMLEIRAGDSILEIGTGSGYNAALMSTLTGPSGKVVSFELEADLAERARHRLRELGYENVEVRTGDAATVAIDETFDGIIVTARAGDIPRAWWKALKDGGRLVLPLDIGYGGERVVGFVLDETRLRSISMQACSFIGLRNERSSENADIFFRIAELRRAQPDARTPIEILARQREDVNADFLENADVVVARGDTFFALTFLS